MYMYCEKYVICLRLLRISKCSITDHQGRMYISSGRMVHNNVGFRQFRGCNNKPIFLTH